MGASNSTPVIKNGDWEHRLCWTAPTTPIFTPVTENSPTTEEPEEEKKQDNKLQNNNNFSIKRSSSITKSLRLSKRNPNRNFSHQKLKQQNSLEETNNGIEMKSFNSSCETTISVLTAKSTKTEEFDIWLKKARLNKVEPKVTRFESSDKVKTTTAWTPI